MNIDSIDLHAVTLPDDGLSLELAPEGVALCTHSSASSLTTASCPISTAGSIMTAASSCSKITDLAL